MLRVYVPSSCRTDATNLCCSAHCGACLTVTMSCCRQYRAVAEARERLRAAVEQGNREVAQAGQGQFWGCSQHTD